MFDVYRFDIIYGEGLVVAYTHSQIITQLDLHVRQVNITNTLDFFMRYLNNGENNITNSSHAFLRASNVILYVWWTLSSI